MYKLDQLWAYINSHQDEPAEEIAKKFNTTIKSVQDLCLYWAMGDRQTFDELLTKIKQ